MTNDNGAPPHRPNASLKKAWKLIERTSLMAEVGLEDDHAALRIISAAVGEIHEHLRQRSRADAETRERNARTSESQGPTTDEVHLRSDNQSNRSERPDDKGGENPPSHSEPSKSDDA